MRNKLIRTGVLAAGLIGLLGTATPAQATTQATATFTGILLTTPMGYPCAPVGTTTTCPPPVGTEPTFRFAFTSTTCVGVKTDVNKPNKDGTDIHGPDCSIRAQGVGTGYCGSAKSLYAVATITYFGPLGTTKSLTVEFLFLWTGNHLTITGTGQKTPGGPPGTLGGSADITPVVEIGGGSCTNLSQMQFIVTGDLSYTELTLAV